MTRKIVLQYQRENAEVTSSTSRLNPVSAGNYQMTLQLDVAFRWISSAQLIGLCFFDLRQHSVSLGLVNQQREFLITYRQLIEHRHGRDSSRRPAPAD